MNIEKKISWLIKNKEKIKNYNHLYYQIYYQKHKERLSQYNKLWYQKNRDRIFNYYHNLPYQKRILRLLKSKISSPSRYWHKKGIKNYLTENDIISLWKRDNANKMKDPCLHRKDNNKHYTIENCQFLERGKHTQVSHFLNGKWSKKFDKCIICKTTKQKHRSFGLCRTCYGRKYITGQKIIINKEDNLCV